MWATTFAFQPWHSAVEFRRYLHRFMLEFTRINTLAGVKRTVFNQYDSLVLPLQHWLLAQGVHLVSDYTVTDLNFKTTTDGLQVIGMERTLRGVEQTLSLDEGDLVLVQNGSMTDASSLGSMTSAPAKLGKAPGCLAQGHGLTGLHLTGRLWLGQRWASSASALDQ